MYGDAHFGSLMTATLRVICCELVLAGRSSSQRGGSISGANTREGTRALRHAVCATLARPKPHLGAAARSAARGIAAAAARRAPAAGGVGLLLAQRSDGRLARR